MIVGHLRAVLTGPARPFTRPGTVSGIRKFPVDGPVFAAADGLTGDEQGDRRVHGGPDKAVHVVPWAHYAAWRVRLHTNALALQRLQAPGAFGENFSLDAEGAVDEHTVCLGDRWTVGDTAVFEVSQGRQPCWKLDDHFNQPRMAAEVQRSGRTGWYLRVLSPGAVQAGAPVHLVARPWPRWPLARLMHLIASRSTEPVALHAALELPLPPSWRTLFARRLASGAAEDASPRLDGPASHRSGKGQP